jgi:bacterioferritin (cytochrome b1)
LQKLSIGETVREAPTADLALEQRNRATLVEGVTLAEAHKDYVSRDLIELIGEPNYLQSAVGGPDENKSQASGGD